MVKDVTTDLMRTFMKKLYDTVTGSDLNIKIPRNKFITWLMPGIPFTPQDFWYCQVGLTGFPTKEKDRQGNVLERSATDNTHILEHQAFVLSMLLDYIPGLPELTDGDNQFKNTRKMLQVIYAAGGDRISKVYGDILNYSRVVHKELSETEKAKIQKIRDKLVTTYQRENLDTGEMETKTKPSPMVEKYNEKMMQYMTAADKYYDLVTSAASATGNDAEAIKRIKDFSYKNPIYLKELQAAEFAWVSEGYKNEVEQYNAYIDQATRNSMLLYKQDLLDKYQKAEYTSSTDGPAARYYYTTLLPGNFATSQGWNTFRFDNFDYDYHWKSQASSWSSSEGAGIFGLFQFAGSEGGSDYSMSMDKKVSNFHATLSFVQVPICRPWLDPGYFSMRGWTLDDLWYINFKDPNDKVSDGKEPRPEGRMIAYPVSALFVKNVNFYYDEAERHLKYASSAISAGGAVGFGPFFLGGDYSGGSGDSNDTQVKKIDGGYSIPGLQLIGFINNFVPKCPNPDPSLKPTDFVGEPHT